MTLRLSLAAFGACACSCPSLLRADVLLYGTDCSSDPGWTTNVPSQMYWDSGGQRYHVESRAGSGQYAFIDIPFNSSQSHKLEFDLTIIGVEYAGGLSFGLNSGLGGWGSVNGFCANYARGDGGTGSTLGFRHSTGVGNMPGPYDFIFAVGTTYHNVVIQDVAAGVLKWRVFDGNTIVADCQANGIGEFAGVDRILCQNDNSGGGSAEGYLDNVRVWSIPSPCTAVALVLGIALPKPRRRR